MKKLSGLFLTLNLIASCAQSRRHHGSSIPEMPPPMEKEMAASITVDEDFYLTVVGKKWKNPAVCTPHDLKPKDLILSVQTTVADPKVVDLVTNYSNSLLPTFKGVRLDSATGAVDEMWSLSTSSFFYRQTVRGTVTPERVELAYHTETLYTQGVTCAYDTVVVGQPRTLRNPASLDGVFTTDYYRYARHDFPGLNCPWFMGKALASEGYRLDVYDRGTDEIRVVIDHGEVEFTLDRRPVPQEENSWHVPATRGRLWDPFNEGSVWVHGTLGADGVDLDIRYVPKPFFLVTDPDNPPDPEAPTCWFDYHVGGDAKRRFDPAYIDGYYRIREEIWDQCNTWQTEPPRVVTENVFDVVKDPSGPRFKILDNFGFVSEFLLTTGNGFGGKETVVYDDGSQNGVKVTWAYRGSFNPPLFEETTYGLYPRGCVVKTWAFGHARFSF